MCSLSQWLVGDGSLLDATKPQGKYLVGVSHGFWLALEPEPPC